MTLEQKTDVQVIQDKLEEIRQELGDLSEVATTESHGVLYGEDDEQNIREADEMVDKAVLALAQVTG